MEVSITEKRSRRSAPARSIVKASVGRLFEDWACLILQKMGYEIISRNVRFQRGEVDIVAWDEKRRRVVVEVRGRTAARFRPVEMLTAGKKRRLLQLALALSRKTGMAHRVEFLEIRGRIENLETERQRIALAAKGKIPVPFEHKIYRIESIY